MRVFLAILALVGLLLSPVAASAAAPACLHHHHDAGMAMDMPMADAGKAMPCCDDDAKQPTHHDSTSCMQACAVICGVTAVMPAVASVRLTEGHARLEPALADPLRAHPPPGLKRPPKVQA